MNNKIAILDFGGQYTHLIANRIRRIGVYTEILPNNIKSEECKQFKGIILSGGPHSVLDKNKPEFDVNIFQLKIPVLGLCYGHQLIAASLGGEVLRGEIREYGIAQLKIVNHSPLFKSLCSIQQVWMSHGDTVIKLPRGFNIIGSTSNCKIAAMGNDKKKIYGLQFHPEVTDTPNGIKILENFINLCSCSKDWNAKTFFNEIKNEVKVKCKNKKVFLLVSGGVDSTVAFTLLNRVLGKKRVLGLHIDNGLMRYKESRSILNFMKKNGYDNLHVIDASKKFLTELKEKYDPEEKRKIIGRVFIEIKEKALKKFGLKSSEWIMGQGTIYPDTIESAGTANADLIKTHHNRVEEVKELLKRGEVIEPLAHLYKDEVRELGRILKIPDELLLRHPFPGPGLGVRLLCSNGKNSKIDFRLYKSVQAIAKKNGYEAIVLPVKSVGVAGDSRTYAHPALIFGKLDWEKLEKISTDITNKVKGINRVIYKLDNSKKEK